MNKISQRCNSERERANNTDALHITRNDRAALQKKRVKTWMAGLSDHNSRERNRGRPSNASDRYYLNVAWINTQKSLDHFIAKMVESIE